MASYLITWLWQSFTGAWQKPVQHDTSSSVDKPCRYCLDNGTSHVFKLPDGREIGYAEYGSLKGKPIFTLHGFPGSRLEGAFLDEAARKWGARLICPERPGIGWSSPHPGRRLLDHANDIKLLADYLEIKDYGVLGISGGGPYALACAVALPPEKLKVVSLVVGVGMPDMSKRGMNWMNWVEFSFLLVYAPSIVRWYVAQDPTSQLDLPFEERVRLKKEQINSADLGPQDAACFRDEDIIRMLVRSSEEQFAQGFQALSQDGNLMCANFDFRMEDIRKNLPVQLWYGKHDTDVPPIYGQQIAARLGNQAELHIEDETHVSLVLGQGCQDRILKDMLSCFSD